MEREAHGIAQELLDGGRLFDGRAALVYGARDEQHNESVVLKAVLDEQLTRTPGRAEDPGQPGSAKD